MKIKMNHSIAGPGFVASIGDVIDRPAAEAKRLIDKGLAEAVKAPARKKTKKKVETAAVSTTETAAER